MTKQGGGSKLSIRYSMIGMLVGLFFFPPWGIVLGPFVGAFVGELIHNSRDKNKALKVAFQSFIAFILTTGLNLTASGVILYYVVKELIF